ncbi:PQQ-binding-like beta-propeller repeat protein [Streptomyces sp. NPDC093595]|uniref:serine/threonine-protein kinase n=1 Tax=Streptomyces sp. NPDC093595 TaxID=3366045 RepID=UPI0038161F1E
MVLHAGDPAEVGGYALEDRLGSGGMGVVYLARSASGRRLAVKVVHSQYADDPEFRSRFRHEVAAARRVSGAFTAPVVDADADAARPWMGTLYIPAPTLGERVADKGPLPLDDLRELAVGLAEALRDIHRAGVVHRDLKPANVLMADDGPRVIDFGISRAAGSESLTQTGRIMGTPPFMSPEQLSRPREAGPASDTFSLGAVLAFAATGRGPFDSDSPYETAIRVVQGEPDLADVPAALRPLVERCLAKDPEERPTPDQLLAWLRTELPAPAPTPAPAAPRPARARRVRRIALAAGGALLAGLLAAVGVPLLTGGDEPPAGSGAPRADLPAGWHAWRRPLAQAGFIGNALASCAVDRAALYCVGGEHRAVRLDPATGKVLWSRRSDAKEAVSPARSSGDAIAGTAAGLLVAFSERGAHGDDPVPYLSAYDTRTGATRWSVPAEHGVLTGAGVFAVDRGWKTYRLIGLADGRTRWTAPLETAAEECGIWGGAGRLRLVCTPRGRYPATRVAEVDPADGRARWSRTYREPLEPVGVLDGVLILTATSTEGADEGAYTALYTVHPTTHALRRIPLAEVAPRSPALVGDRLYVPYGNGRLRAVSPRTGETLWDAITSVENLSLPAAGRDGTLYATSGSGRVVALDPRTGAERWVGRRPQADDEQSSNGDPLPAPLLIGDALYASAVGEVVFSLDVTRRP